MKYQTMIAGVLSALSLFSLTGCNLLNSDAVEAPVEAPPFVSLEDVARLFAALPLETGHVEEVYDAATASAANGYDEEYRMQDLFAAPGTGVGDDGSTKAGKYARPLRELLREAALSTKASADGGVEKAEAWLDSLSMSDVQIYWPFSESWNGDALPVITYDPGDGALSNEGYVLRSDGSVQKILVDEKMASERPVWVMNRNSDADYKSLEMRRREDPSWGSGGGDIVVKADADAGEQDFQTLILRSFQANRQFDSWFSGASEFFVKMGSIEDFRASTEAELRLYQPTITDFMIVVRRSQLGTAVPFNAILVSEWTDALDSCAFMIIEDDGGTRTSWKASATVKYNSKSYGIDMDIPLNTRDDIVWRGSLSHSFIEKYNGEPCNFGDVTLVLELI